MSLRIWTHGTQFAGLKAKNHGVDCAIKLLNERSKAVTENTLA
jgi:hypothetical protein